MSETSKPDTVPVYRVENPNIAVAPNGVTSHEELVGQWFSPNLDSALGYLRKSTQTFGKDAGPIDGAQLVVAELPLGELEAHHVSQHPIASGMDVEGDNYIVPRDGSIPTEVIPLDETLGGLQGQLGNTEKFAEAKERVHAMLGQVAVEK